MKHLKTRNKMKHIQIIHIDDKHFVVNNKHDGSMIGKIGFYTAWRKWVFEPDEGTIYDYSCLIDLAEFLKSIKEGKNCAHCQQPMNMKEIAYDEGICFPCCKGNN